MWVDRRKKNTISLRLDDAELFIVDEIAEALNVDRSEAIRRCIWAYRVLFDPDLKLKNALIDDPDPEKPLYENLKPIPILAHIIGIELKIWRKAIRGEPRKNNAIT